MEGLSEDETIETIRRQRARLAEVGDQGCARIVTSNIDHVAARDPGSSEIRRVLGTAYFEHPTLDVSRMRRQELLDVDTIHRQTSFRPVIVTERTKTLKIAPQWSG